MLHTQTVEPNTLGLLKRLMADDTLRSFNLVGGTALSLQIGHRKSIDLDLFTQTDFVADDIITNQSYSTAAKNRASVKNLSLEVVTLSELATIEFDYDDIINMKINNLSLSKAEFFERNQSNSGYFDLHNSSYEKRIIAFKPGFADTEYYAFKKIIKESARSFRDFPQLDKITIQIPTKSTSSEEQGRMYYATVSKYDLEKHLHLDFSELMQDIKNGELTF